ncbi:MAG: hypothetical protein AAGI50_10870 [Pseudomonadota bacterium]
MLGEADDRGSALVIRKRHGFKSHGARHAIRTRHAGRLDAEAPHAALGDVRGAPPRSVH